MMFLRPVDKQFPISSPFGITRKLLLYQNSPKIHYGVDFSCPEKTPVFAMCDGNVLKAGWQDENDMHRGMGLRIWQVMEADDGEAYDVFYGHLSWIIVGVGADIRQGQEIGLSGNTGGSTGPHLHVALRHHGTVDGWLEPKFDEEHMETKNNES